MLRVLVILFILLFCFASLSGSAVMVSRRGMVLREKAVRELDHRNQTTGSLLALW